MSTHALTRRNLLLGGLGVAATATLTACTGARGTTGTPTRTIGAPAPVTPSAGQRVVEKALTAKPVTLDLGGRSVSTWAYGETVPGPLARAKAGDLLRINLDNQLPADTTIHWHGIRLRNAADGVPGQTQDPIRPGSTYVYEFTAPDPGTYFFHPHVGVQLDRGLYAPMVIEDPNEPGNYDTEWTLVLDDWVDGTGTTPDEVLKKLIADGGPATGSMGGMGGMGGMDHGSMGGMGAGPWGDAGDVAYPLFLINGRPPNDPDVLTAKPGQRVRLRIISAASDTIFTVALGGHRLTVTHTDGHAVEPAEVDALYIGMGERYDAVVTLKDGAFPFVARPFGKTSGGQAMALVRTGSGTPPGADITPNELTGQILIGSQLQPAPSAKLPEREPDAQAQLTLNGSMKPYQWGINGATFGDNDPLTVKAGQRLRIHATNMTMMTHPLHLHGHTFALPSGLRKDTVLMAPMQSFAIDLDADNVGDWMIHCHNIYHAEAGMMIALNYTA
ncbi:multicopper oxidase family protein [Branchiibius sp. NY16-3462-2]|uniref:multicopper oxidase family protein n=1 Tax=Branchiibius sp. NY16-3462-2 TaxID=1807500 RepID=UPI000791CEBF|nr:multicopper oxidase family protein [Branchiibius sp. NY16-3462-2]KYH45574.1 copper oxidase [Branchiibius sp. NY16-3462-2]